MLEMIDFVIRAGAPEPIGYKGENLAKTLEVITDSGPGLKGDGSLVKSGTRINWNGVVKRAAVDLWDTETNNPDNAPTLWENLAYIDGIRIIPEVITVGTAFSKGEQGWWNGALYESQADNNVWTPDAYPAYWEEV